MPAVQWERWRGRTRRIRGSVAVSGARGLSVRLAGGSEASGATATRTSTRRIEGREFQAARKPADFRGTGR